MVFLMKYFQKSNICQQYSNIVRDNELLSALFNINMPYHNKSDVQEHKEII